jgi:hypothetical protein
MIVMKYTGSIFGAKRIKIAKDGVVTVDDSAPILPPVTIKSETCAGFFALENLMPMFEHMKCWKERRGEECGTCPVKHDGVCGIMGIKDAAEEEALEKGDSI